MTNKSANTCGNSHGCHQGALPVKPVEAVETIGSGSNAEMVYTCPMHPEVRAGKFDVCPICGMGLEPLHITADQEPNHEYLDMRLRFVVALVLTLPVFVLEMTSHIFGGNFDLSGYLGDKGIIYLQMILSTPVVLWCGWLFLKRGWNSVATLNLNMFTLISLGVIIAWIYSMVATVAPGIFLPEFHNTDGSVPVYFEAAAIIVTLALLGQVLELKARERTGSAVRSLLNLVPDMATRVLANGDEQQIALNQIAVDDLLKVRPGEKIPTDGEVIEGTTSIDEAMITGEPEPVMKSPGQQVIGGTINQTGSFILRALSIGSDTVLCQIVQLVNQAQRGRMPIQRLADLVAAWFVPIVITIALITFFAWAVVAQASGYSYGLIAAISVLIIACPCALGLATPMSIMVGLGKGAQNGVLIKNAEALELMERVDTLVVDKTGTLTEGSAKLSKIYPLNGLPKQEILRLAASLEDSSEHPISVALLEAAKQKGQILDKVSDFNYFVGKGISGMVNGHAVMLGNIQLFTEKSSKSAEVFAKKNKTLTIDDGASQIFMELDGKPCAILIINDPIKATTPAAIKRLQNMGLDLIMLTGDNYTTARAVATKLGISKVIAQASPKDKILYISKLRDVGKLVAMVGDGINDAPALAEADVAIAMATGTDIAISSADIILLHGDLRGVVKIKKLSQATINNIKQNLLFAFGYNAIGVPIAAGILYPIFGLLLTPVFAAIAMSLSSVSVIVNALRLKFAKV